MTHGSCTFRIYLLMVSIIASLCLAAAVEAGPVTTPAVRMKAWDHHVNLRDSSIFKDVAWTAVGPRIQGGRIESVWSVKKRKSTLYCGVGSGNLWKSVNNGTTWKPIFESESTFSIAVVTVSDKDPNLVWVGTGEPQMSRSAFPGTGVAAVDRESAPGPQ
ncbi:MAG: hypothetical protein HN919_18415 [Verrucomicrobia bacterium]|jgi:hypothetical protein|nr:hypothetical protein [Verrucomicrobiota bacterium]MBT7701758.1 hypothetical protein [Verrucomicrobiota bacterium]